MRYPASLLIGLTISLLVCTNAPLRAVNTSEIDRVRNKAVLNGNDFEVIDNFVNQAVQELIETTDFTTIAKIRTAILANSRPSKDSAAAQYTEQFAESAGRHISAALQKADELTEPDHKVKLLANLLILIDELQDLRLVTLAQKYLNNENTVIRYWAVHAVTEPGVRKQLNSTKADVLQLARDITGQLSLLVGNSSSEPEILAMIAEFAADTDLPRGRDLLLKITDTRIKKYADWNVNYRLLDAKILKLLHKNIAATNLSSPDLGRRFAQLYSYTIQQYIENINGGNFLSPREKGQLASVLVEVEKSCVSKILETPQSIIKNAIERDDFNTLTTEHERLLGRQNKPGRIPTKLKFDYGVNPDGSKRIAPLKLPPRPKAKTDS